MSSYLAHTPRRAKPCTHVSFALAFVLASYLRYPCSKACGPSERGACWLGARQRRACPSSSHDLSGMMSRCQDIPFVRAVSATCGRWTFSRGIRGFATTALFVLLVPRFSELIEASAEMLDAIGPVQHRGKGGVDKGGLVTLVLDDDHFVVEAGDGHTRESVKPATAMNPHMSTKPSTVSFINGVSE